MEPLVTIWCITFNQVKFIRDALDGFVKQQTNFSFKVIVHDDASTDGTTDIILEYSRKYPDLIIPFIEKENQWQHGGLKQIVKIMAENHANTKYVAFCEGDDFWTDPQKLQKQVDFLEKNPAYSLCFHSAKKQYECDATCWIDCEHVEDREYSPTEIFVNWTVPTASVVCKKEGLDFFKNVKGFERIQNYDIFIFLSCAMVGKMYGMSEMMSVYRIQGGGLTYNQAALKKTAMRNPQHFECLKENFPIVDSKYVDDTISKVYFERSVFQEKTSLAIKDFAVSFRYNPQRALFSLCKHAGKEIKQLFVNK